MAFKSVKLTTEYTDAHCLNLNDLPEGLIIDILSKLPMQTLLTMGYQVCKQWAVAAEVVVGRACAAQRWALPRRPRGAAAAVHVFPARALYLRHACAACGVAGEFAVREGSGFKTSGYGVRQLFLLCKRCTRKGKVQAFLQSNCYHIDLVGVSGKKLLDAGQLEAARTGRPQRGRGRAVNTGQRRGGRGRGRGATV